MGHKHKSKYESDSSEDSSSSSSSSSSDSDIKKSSKKQRRSSNSSDDYKPSTKKKKNYSESDDSDDDKYKKKTVKSAIEKLPKYDDEKTRSHTHHSEKHKFERRSNHREKNRDDKDSDSRRDKYDNRHDTDRKKDENHDRRDDYKDRRNDYRDRSRNYEEQSENRHSYQPRRRERVSRDRSRSRDDRDRNLNDKRRDRPWNRRNRSRSKSFDHANANWGKNHNSDTKSDKKNKEKDKPNFGLSGKLTEETNTYKGVVIKYSEPPEARKPRRRWRLYPFKGEKSLQTLYIHRQSAYLIGRDRNIADLPVDHPSCSKQHAALQYRLVQFTRDDGTVGKRVRPYIIDLESANGTFVNNKKIDPKKYVELLERDVIKFGFSSREYVLLHENSKDEALDDDVKLEDEEGEVKVKKEEP